MKPERKISREKSPSRPAPAGDETLRLRRRVAELEALEKARQAAMQALDESERRFRSVFEKVSSGILITSWDGRILMANRPALAGLGLEEKSVGTNLPAQLPQARRLLSRARLGIPQRMEFTAAHGKRRLLGFTNEPVMLAEGKGLITFLQDLSELQQAEDRRRRTEQLAYVGELAARLSHEIKNPLAAIQAGIKLLVRHQGDYSTDDRAVLGMVTKELEDVIQLLSGLLNTARYDPFQPEVLDLGGMLQEACAIFSSLAQSKGIRFSLQVLSDQIAVPADRKAFGRAVGNLIHNALDAVGRDGAIEVEALRASRAEVERSFPGFASEVVCIQVRDDGPGIAPGLKTKIFQPFFTTKVSGTGLGLAVAQDIVESHGGVLRASSPPGKGTVFEIFLPAGERRPCWEWEVYHEWEEFYGSDRCASCEVKKSGRGHLCWRRKLEEAKPGGERYPERCLRCPVFLAGNLAPYYQPED